LTNSRDDVMIDNILSHPVGPIPVSMFHENGTMRKYCKSDLVKQWSDYSWNSWAAEHVRSCAKLCQECRNVSLSIKWSAHPYPLIKIQIYILII
jgi:hypothetical protein